MKVIAIYVMVPDDKVEQYKKELIRSATPYGQVADSVFTYEDFCRLDSLWRNRRSIADITIP